MIANNRFQPGFTLVEVLVASSIAIASMGLILSLFATGLDRMARMESLSQQMIVEKEVVNRISMINPASQEAGSGMIGDWSYSWRASPLSGYESLSEYFIEDERTRLIALFQVDIQLESPAYKTKSLSVKKLGWQL